MNIIEGNWSLSGKDLTLTNITADFKGGYKDATLICYRAQGLQVELNGTKFVFHTQP